MDFVRDKPSEPLPEETFTHSHLSWSSIAPYLLHPSNTTHGVLPIQLMRLTVFFHNLSPSFLWSMFWPGTLHFILYISSPNHCLLFAMPAHSDSTATMYETQTPPLTQSQVAAMTKPRPSYNCTWEKISLVPYYRSQQ